MESCFADAGRKVSLIASTFGNSEFERTNSENFRKGGLLALDNDWGVQFLFFEILRKLVLLCLFGSSTRFETGLMEIDEGVARFLCSRMGFLVSGSEFFGGEVGIDLGGGKVRVS